MHIRSVHYKLDHGFIHNWLVAGPQTIPVEPGQFTGDLIRQQIIQHYYESDSGIVATPVERGPLTEGLFQVGDYQGSWNYFACREDHLIEHSGIYPSPHYLRSWAYTQLKSRTDQEVLLVLTTHGPADVWLNDQHVHRQEHFCKQQPESVSFKVFLKKGGNKILVRFEAVALPGCAYALALQVSGPTEEQSAGHQELDSGKLGIEVTIPSLIHPLTRRNNFESVATKTYIAQDVFESDERIRLYWPNDFNQPSSAVVRLMTPTGQIYAEANVDGTPGDHLTLQIPRQIPMGDYRIFMMPLASEYYEHNLRITREVSLWGMGKNQYSTFPYGTYEERCREALISASQWRGLFAEIAKMALHQWEEVDTKEIIKALQNAGPLEIVGILGMVYRFVDQPEFPRELLQPLEDYILKYPYQRDALMEKEESESDHILLHTAEILAGQRYPERKFTQSGKTGQWHRQNGEQLALAWLRQRGESGFSDWDSSSSFAGDVVAFSHLIDLAETESVWDMAAVVMDKLFVTLAINSYRGVFGSTHGRISASHVKGGVLEPTSGIARLMWGVGIFNHHIAGPVSLVCMENYEFPSLIADIALSLPDEVWGRERHAVNSTRAVNKVAYKTPDYMLCSAQDYYPGTDGRLEHIWQATLDHRAAVFVTHPACTNEDDARQPNFWAGNKVLPRVAQWKDTLIAVYQLPEDDWMGFTHAYFPIHAFDEYAIHQGWAFARKGDGYLAITASQGFNLITSGYYALRELRSYGQNNIWLCQMGRAALDGDFSSFQEKILAMNVNYEGTSVSFTTLRGEVLSFGWQGPFLRDGLEQSLSDFNHYENPYVASEYPSKRLEIGADGVVLRLEFGKMTDPKM